MQYHEDRGAMMPYYDDRDAGMQYHEDRNARIPYYDDRDQEKQHQESQQMIQTREEVVLQRRQIREDFRHMREQSHENLRQMLCELDKMIEICRELEQEEEDVQIQKIPNPLEGVIHQTAASFNDFSHNGVHNNEAKDMQNQEILNPINVYNDVLLDLSSEIESIDFKKLHLVFEKAEIKERIEKLTVEQEFVKIFSDSDGFYCDAEKTFDKKLERKLVDDVFFLGCGKWCFDPGKKLLFLEETFSNLNQCSNSNTGASDLSKKLESMELEKLQLFSKNAKNKAREVIRMSKSEKASPVVLAIWRMTDGGFNQVSVLRIISRRANINLKLNLLKYLVVLRHRWRWKDGVLLSCRDVVLEDMLFTVVVEKLQR